MNLLWNRRKGRISRWCGIVSIFAGFALISTGCGGLASPPPEPTEGPTQRPETTPLPTSTHLPGIKVESVYPNASTPLADLVILRGENHVFDPSASVSGGVGKLSFAWDFNSDGTVDSTMMDPNPVQLAPGVYHPVFAATDQAGQSVSVELPKVVKVGDPVWPDWNFGVAAHVNLSQGLYKDDGEVNRALDMIQAAGIQAIRVNFLWGAIEPTDGQFNWTEYDSMMKEIEVHHLKVVGILDSVPQWASSGPESADYWAYAPKNVDDYGDFVMQVVARYGEEVQAWSIWNEPNNSYFFQSADPARYFALLKEAFRAIKYSNPESIVIIGGLANGPLETGVAGMDPNEFVTSAFDVGAADYCDGVGLHPYTDVGKGVGAMTRKVSMLRQVMDEHGGKNLFLAIDEYGVPVIPGLFTGHFVANWLGKSFSALRGMDGIGPVFWYNFRDKGTDSSNPEQNFGLVTHDFEPKPAYDAYEELINGSSTK